MLLFFSFCALLAFYFRRDGVPLVLLGSVALSAFVWSGFDRAAAVAASACIDALLVLALLGLVVRYRNNVGLQWCECSRRAQVVGMISIAKIMVSMAYVSGDLTANGWVIFAWVINGAFVLQCAVAGGMLNGMAERLVHRVDRATGGLLGRLAHQANP